MTIFPRFRLTLFAVLIVFCGFNVGCDLGTYAQRAESSSQGYVAPEVVMPQASSEEDGKPDGPVIAGSWAMDATATADLVKRKVNPIIIGGPAIHGELVEALRNGSMDFELKADGTFTCIENLKSQTANYKGNWKFNGGQITINQTHKNNSPEQDSLVGTVSGNKMDLKTKNQGVSLPMILRRR